MRLLLDSCVWGGAKKVLIADGHDVESVAELGADPGDEEVLGRAFESGRVLVTIDKDFGQLAVLFGQKHCGIIRLVNLSARQQAAVWSLVVQQYGSDLEGGAIITAEIGRIRIRKGTS